MINVEKNNIKATDNANYIVFIQSIDWSCLMFDTFRFEYQKQSDESRHSNSECGDKKHLKLTKKPVKVILFSEAWK